jgi:hypothetical protein
MACTRFTLPSGGAVVLVFPGVADLPVIAAERPLSASKAAHPAQPAAGQLIGADPPALVERAGGL